MSPAGSAGAGGGAMLSTVFMGTPEIAVPALQLLSRMTTVRLVVTQPDRPAGRGNQLHEPAVKRAARELGLPLWQPETLRGQAGAAALQDADLFVVMAYGELLRQEVLDLPRAGCINLHASLLPRWRGASPLQAALRAGDRATGVTVMRMVRALDAGPVYLARRIELAERATLGSLHDAIGPLAADALADLLAEWPVPAPTPQDEAQATLCRKLTAEDGRLRFDCSPLELERWVRAYTPAPGCWALAGSERLRVLAVEPRPADAGGGGLGPGALAVHAGELLVGCAGGACAILRLQAAGKREMTAADYLRGHRVPERLS
jgi:methionyl-tRNA formyltransferase